MFEKLFHAWETFVHLTNFSTIKKPFQVWLNFTHLMNFSTFHTIQEHQDTTSSYWSNFFSCCVSSYGLTRFRNFQINLSRSSFYYDYFKFLLSSSSNICFFWTFKLLWVYSSIFTCFFKQFLKINWSLWRHLSHFYDVYVLNIGSCFYNLHIYLN